MVVPLHWQPQPQHLSAPRARTRFNMNSFKIPRKQYFSAAHLQCGLVSLALVILSFELAFSDCIRNLKITRQYLSCIACLDIPCHVAAACESFGTRYALHNIVSLSTQREDRRILSTLHACKLRDQSHLLHVRRILRIGCSKAIPTWSPIWE